MDWFLLMRRYHRELVTSAVSEEDRLKIDCGIEEPLLEVALGKWRRITPTSEEACKTSF